MRARIILLGPRRVRPVAVVMLALLLLLAGPASRLAAAAPPPLPQQPQGARLQLPEGAGKAEVQRLCTSCHDLERILNQRKSPSAWEATVADMLGRLSPAMEEESRVISGYLATHFGPHASDSLARVRTLLVEGERERAARLVQEDPVGLAPELEEILGQMDRGFDELGRQKARYDILDEKFDRFDSTWLPYQEVFQLYADATGQRNPLIRFRAKRLRVEGARHTTTADHLWDQLRYRESLDEYARATSRLREAIALARSADDQKLVAACLTNIGYAEIYSGNHPEGLRTYDEALRIAAEREDEVFQGMYLLNLSTYYLYTQQGRKGLEYALRASRANARTGRRTWEANSLLNAGSAYFYLGRKEEADSYLQKALLKARESRDARSHGRILYNLAMVKTQFGRLDEAASLMEQALDWYDNNPIVYNQGEHALIRHRGLQFLITAHRNLNQTERAEHFTRLFAEQSREDPGRLETYLADPHLNFAMWDRFRSRFGIPAPGEN